MRFSKLLQISMFIFDETLQKYVVTIDADTIGFGGTVHFSVLKVVRRDSSSDPWRNVLFQYEIDSSGNLRLLFDEQFAGKVTLITDNELTSSSSLGGAEYGYADY